MELRMTTEAWIIIVIFLIYMTYSEWYFIKNCGKYKKK